MKFNRSRRFFRYPSKSWPIQRITSQSGSPGCNSPAPAKRRSSVVSIGEFSLNKVSRATPSQRAVSIGPRVSNHSAGSSQSQNFRASS